MKENNERAIAKTLLVLWPQMSGYCTMLEQKIHKTALGSFGSPNSTRQIMEKIINITAQKDIINNLQKELTHAISKFPPDTQQLLTNFFYNKQKTANDISAEMNLSRRSFYRRLDSAVDKLARGLKHMGINAFTWSNLTDNHAWIREAFNYQVQPAQTQTPPE
jgi:DNA-directed RNA polymerase specialized sigma subunit